MPRLLIVDDEPMLLDLIRRTRLIHRLLVPLGWIAGLEPSVRIGIGAVIVLAGLVTTSAGRRALIKGGTNVNPSLPTTQLVTDGVFGYTRNPLYVGISVALCGIALLSQSINGYCRRFVRAVGGAVSGSSGQGCLG